MARPLCRRVRGKRGKRAGIGDTTTSPVTADGTVIYNIDGDNLGDFRWDLTGSPSL
ncbi:hypothetical protein ACFWPV_02515 [Streptomyces uncialis]|uniref:hypothetical protein n=1 Tax=Streptomyces uncialis TaxID=1048205 RepID=UPI00364D9344